MFAAADSMFHQAGELKKRPIIQSKWPKSFAPSSGCHDTETSGFQPELQTAVAVVVVVGLVIREQSEQQNWRQLMFLGVINYLIPSLY